MGLNDRDYMKEQSRVERDPEYSEGSYYPESSSAADWVNGFLTRHPNLLRYISIAVGVLIALALVAALVFPAHRHH